VRIVVEDVAELLGAAVLEDRPERVIERLGGALPWGVSAGR